MPHGPDPVMEGLSGLEALQDRRTIEKYFRRDPLLHIYELGDLDDFYFGRTIWYAWRSKGEIQAVVLLYGGGTLPVLIALDRRDPSPLRGLLLALRNAGRLPRECYIHISPGLIGSLASPDRPLRPHGRHLKMALVRPDDLRLDGWRESVAPMSPADGIALREFYDHSYPGNWYDPRMLETGKYFAIYRGKRIASVAGVHVLSSARRVAAIGNVATAPEWRGRGLATATCAALSRALRSEVDHIGLNVHSANHAAIASYRRIGFEVIGEYFEFAIG